MDVGGRATVQVKVRAPGLEDADVVAAVLNRHAAETGDHRATAEELRGWWTAPDFDPASQALVAEADDTAVGYVDVGDPNGDTSQLWIDLRVPEDGRLLGADSLLLDRIMELAGSGAGAEAVFRGFGDARDDRTIDLFRERGFEVVRHGFRMTRSLDDPPPEPAWPVGIRVRTAEPETDLRPVYDAYRETFADAWGGVEEPYADFLHGWGVGEQFDPTLWFVAEDGGELAGIALCRSQRGGETDLGWVSILGVRRRWRRRGLGRALLLHTFYALRSRGKLRVGLGVDADSPTGAVALYESVGMTVTKRTVTLERRV